MKQLYLPEGSRIRSEENREAVATLSALERAIERESILEGIVTLCDGDLRLHVELPCAEGILEREEAVYCHGTEERKDIAILTRVGKPISFCVLRIEYHHGRPVAILSRRRAQKKCIEAYLAELCPGDILTARVTHLEPFGAFLDLGCGVSSLLSVDCISVSRISHPKDRLQVGMTLPVVIKSIDRETGRIYASLRELLGTWEENAARFCAGQTVRGVIRSVESYGVFVELAPNLAGLAELRGENADELRARIGQPVAVYIKSILPERMKVKLVLIDVCPSSPETCTPPLRYYVDTSLVKHLSHWVYSPPGASKRIETLFDPLPF